MKTLILTLVFLATHIATVIITGQQIGYTVELFAVGWLVFIVVTIGNQPTTAIILAALVLAYWIDWQDIADEYQPDDIL